MSNRKPDKLTIYADRLIRRLAKEHWNSREIAEIIGCEPSYLRKYCSKHKIKLTRHQFSNRFCMTLLMLSGHYSMLSKAASDHNVEPKELAQSLLELVLEGQLVDAILDGEPVHRRTSYLTHSIQTPGHFPWRNGHG